MKTLYRTEMVLSRTLKTQARRENLQGVMQTACTHIASIHVLVAYEKKVLHDEPKPQTFLSLAEARIAKRDV